jgi:hypothetical protein
MAACAKGIAIHLDLDNVRWSRRFPRKARPSMPSRSLLRPTLCLAPALAPLILVACGGRGPLDTDIAAYDAPHAAGLRGPGEPGSEDAGTRPTQPVDAGPGTKDAGSSPPGLPGLGADAGGIAACFGCAEASCGMQVNACVASSACFAEGTCDLGCLGGAAGGTTTGGASGGLNLECLQACTKDQQANQDLLAALTCTFESCSSQCLSALGSAGTGLGGLGALLGTQAATPAASE